MIWVKQLFSNDLSRFDKGHIKTIIKFLIRQFSPIVSRWTRVLCAFIAWILLWFLKHLVFVSCYYYCWYHLNRQTWSIKRHNLDLILQIELTFSCFDCRCKIFYLIEYVKPCSVHGSPLFDQICVKAFWCKLNVFDKNCSCFFLRYSSNDRKVILRF